VAKKVGKSGKEKVLTRRVSKKNAIAGSLIESASLLAAALIPDELNAKVIKKSADEKPDAVASGSGGKGGVESARVDAVVEAALSAGVGTPADDPQGDAARVVPADIEVVLQAESIDPQAFGSDGFEPSIDDVSLVALERSSSRDEPPIGIEGRGVSDATESYTFAQAATALPGGGLPDVVQQPLLRAQIEAPVIDSSAGAGVASVTAAGAEVASPGGTAAAAGAEAAVVTGAGVAASGATISTAALVAGAAVGVAAVAGGGGGGGGVDALTVAAHNLIAGGVVAGPVAAGNQLTVNLYRADGTTLLGTQKLSDSGTFSIDVGAYSGVVFAKLVDGDAGADYIDEATGQARDLSGNLMAVGVAAGGVTTVNINPLTTIAAIKAGAVFDGGSVGITSALVIQTNAAVAGAFGLTDLVGGSVVTTVDITGAANAAYTPGAMSAAENYGAVLAALSGMDSANGGNMQATINSLVAGITINGSTATIGFDVTSAIVAGAAAASVNGAGSGASSLT
jgi:hypothetical protein